MSVHAEGNRIRLEGRCRVEDAEPLLRQLLEIEAPVVDLSAATQLHTAVVQVLLAARPEIAGTPADPVLARWILAGGADR